ncbi:MAG TPA: methionyl-tRNA formyltransferase [Aggregatilineales bacterium]|nr:methionyl-tRNA formyltransferase [Anaerolineales bacterium]HRE49225.1 methionyl-tRNA formyltransferase [Aggregatilineales bacterium]
MPYRIVFMGTPDFAVPPLHALIASPQFAVAAVVTQPDRPAGRGNKLQQSPVKQAALAASLPVLQPEKLRAPGVFESLAAFAPDLIVVAAFGHILRQNILDLPPYGCVNIHASLLPRWRGAAPIQAAIRAGDAETGITMMTMDAGLDTGAILRSAAIPITATETGDTLHDKMATLGGAMLIETLLAYLAGAITPTPQAETGSTYAPMLKKEDGRIDWTQPAEAIDRQVRAYHPFPGTFTFWNGEYLKILPALTPSTPSAPPTLAGDAPPGQVIFRDGVAAIGTGAGVYIPQRVQVAGRPALSVSDFLNGRRDFLGALLGR